MVQFLTCSSGLPIKDGPRLALPEEVFLLVKSLSWLEEPTSKFGFLPVI